MIESLFTAAAPLMLASLGALFTDLAGALGIFIEGFMTLGAFFSWIIAVKTGSVFGGILLSASALAVLGWLLFYFVHKTGANPFIAGLALNLAAGGITDSLSAAWFGTKGVLRNPGIILPGPVHIPFIAELPLAGPLLSGHLFSVYLAWAITILAALAVEKTSPGLRLRAVGRSPEAAAERGIRTGHYQAAAWAAAAFLAGLAGAALTFRVGAYAPGAIAGRGWIALAAVYLGFHRVWGVAAAAFIFAGAEILGFGIQGLGKFSATLLMGFPSALALILYSVSNLIRKKNQIIPGASF